MDNPVRTYFLQSGEDIFNLSTSIVVPSRGSIFQFVDVLGSSKRSKKVKNTKAVNACPPAPMSTLSVKKKEDRADLTCRLPVLVPPHHFHGPLSRKKKIHPWTNSMPCQFVKLVANSVVQNARAPISAKNTDNCEHKLGPT